MEQIYITVSSKGQMVIPAAIREELGIEAGTRVAVRLEGTRVILEPDSLAAKLRRIDEMQGLTAGGPSGTRDGAGERRLVGCAVTIFVLDSSAVLRYIDNEAGGDRVKEILKNCVRRQAAMRISALQGGEVAGHLRKRLGNSEGKRALDSLLPFELEVIPATGERAVRAAELRSDRRISYVDAFAVELATNSSDHVLVTADYDFNAVDDLVRVNGYNEAFTGWGREDSELAARLLNTGLQRLDMRGRALCFHLWHPPASRAQLAANDGLLESTLREKNTRCEHGLDHHG